MSEKSSTVFSTASVGLFPAVAGSAALVLKRLSGKLGEKKDQAQNGSNIIRTLNYCFLLLIFMSWQKIFSLMKQNLKELRIKGKWHFSSYESCEVV